MKKLLMGAVLAGAFGAFAITAARVDEIAGWLPERPAADGARVTDRAAWTKLAATPGAAGAIAAAEASLAKPLPVASDAEYLEFTQNGNRTHYQKNLFRLLGVLDHLVVAECLEDRGRFLPKLVETVDAVCALRSWTLPAHDGRLTCFNGTPHVDLGAGHIALALAFCHDWLGPRLPEATRAKLAAELDRRILQPHLRHACGQEKNRNHWWFHSGNNWNSVCNSCVVRTALAVVPDRRLRAEFVAYAEESVPYALKGYNNDGYCSEGMGYWNYGFGHHLMMGLSVRAATRGKVDFFADPKCKTVMQYAYGFQIEDGKSPHFADGGGNANPVYLALGRQVWPDLVNTAALESAPFPDGKPGRGGNWLPVFPLRAFGQEPTPVPPTLDALPPRTWFPEAQVFIARARQPARKLAFGVAFKGGHNAELHNHNDVGTYTLMLDGVEMAGDPGGEVYTRRTFSKDRYVSKVLNSYGHPVPVVGGKLQSVGRAAAAQVLRTAFTDDRDEIEIEYAAAYDVPALKSLRRALVFDRAQGALTITDRVVCTAPTAFEVPVITYRTWTKDAAAMRFAFDKSADTKRKLTLDVSASAPIAFAETAIENPGRPSPRRLAFTFAEPVTEATLTTTFTSR